MITPIFINEFQKGTAENANIGYGNFVGIDTQSQQGVVRASHPAVKVSGTTVTGLGKYFANKDDDELFMQDDDGKIYEGATAGESWTLLTGNTLTSASGNGLVYFEGYLFAFRNTEIDYWDGAVWTNGWQTGLTNAEHFPFIYPSAYGFYFANGNKLGFIGSVVGTTFDPSGTIGTDYLYTDNIFELPSLYTIECMAFLPPNQLMMGTSSKYDATVADIIAWDTVSKNKFSPPLRLYARAYEGQNGVRQLINRNNTLYAVTGGNHCIFETNGTNFREVENLSRSITYRNSAGNQLQFETFLNPERKAIAVIGNKLFTGVSTRSSKPSGTSGSYGLYPFGVWSVAFNEEGEYVQCEYTISTNNTVATSVPLKIGAIQATTQGRLLIAWEDSITNTFGIDLINIFKYQTNASVVVLESPMYEIAEPLTPTTVNLIQINLVRNLLNNQSINVYYRTGFDQDYTLLSTIAGDGTKSYYTIDTNPIGQCTFIQLRVTMGGNSGTETTSPEIRNIIIS